MAPLLVVYIKVPRSHKFLLAFQVGNKRAFLNICTRNSQKNKKIGLELVLGIGASKKSTAFHIIRFDNTHDSGCF